MNSGLARGTSRPGRCVSLDEQLMNFFIRRLREIVVPEPDRAKRFWRDSANDVVSDVTKCIAGCRGRDGNCHDNAAWHFLPERGHRGAHGRTRRKSVIHQEDCLASQIREGAIATVASLAALQLDLFRGRDAFDILRAHACDPNEVVVEDPHPTARERTHRQLFVPGEPELSNNEDIERNVECRSDFVSYRHAPTRKRQNDHISAIRVRAKLRGEASSRIAAVAKA